MTITELINRQRENALAHERALRELAYLAESLCAALGMKLIASNMFEESIRLRHTVSLWPNGERRFKCEMAEQIRPLLPAGWSIKTDTGAAWMYASGQLGGHQVGLTIYTGE